MDVALVAVVAPNIENHSIAALRAALDEAGRTSCVIPFEGFLGLDAMIEAVLRVRPRVCGVSL
jgi:hypothetical protein